MTSPEERIAEVSPLWLRRLPGIHTDPIWMEYALETVDPVLKTQLMAVRLETVAAVYRTMAEGVAKAAQVVAARAGG